SRPWLLHVQLLRTVPASDGVCPVMRVNSPQWGDEFPSTAPQIRNTPSLNCALSFLVYDSVVMHMQAGSVLPDHRFWRCLEACDHHAGEVEHLLDSRQQLVL